MSVIDLDVVKKDLRITHSEDDDLLQIYLDSAEDEALHFMDRNELPLDGEGAESDAVSSSDAAISPSVYRAVLLLVRAGYDATTPDEIEKLRKCAETTLMPFRKQLGV